MPRAASKVLREMNALAEGGWHILDALVDELSATGRAAEHLPEALRSLDRVPSEMALAARWLRRP